MCKITRWMMTWATIMLLGTGITQAQAVSATGGTVTNYTDAGGTNWTAHIFTTVGTTSLTVSAGGNVEVLVVGGGGGGGGSESTGAWTGGGGGGAGGMLTVSTNIAGSVSIVVGAGGAGGGTSSVGAPGGNGSNSVLGSIIAFGGGGGGQGGNSSAPARIGLGGGSGGGSGYRSTAGGPATNTQGNAGGHAGTGEQGSGGGGGAGAVGGNGWLASPGYDGGTGGVGRVSAITGTTNYYAGGGGAGGLGGYGDAGDGGLGGGGKGAKFPTFPAEAGATNTGGGGGGGTRVNANQGNNPGAAGGSGIVVVRYLGNTDSPVIQNAPATSVTTDSATFNGWLVSTGSSATAVCVLWGEENGGQNWAWANTNWWDTGVWTNDTYPGTNMTLSPNQQYYYTFGASNDTTNVVASTPQYLITGEVTVEATDPTAQYPGNNGEFTIRRPPALTNEALVVNYTMSGTAIGGTDYTALPASVTLTPGVSNIAVTVIPLRVSNPTREAVMTLAAGSYAVGTSYNAATVTILQAQAIHVATNGTNDVANNFNTWEGAATNIHDAVALANTLGTMNVLVSNGVYRTTSTLVVSNGVQMLGFSNDPADVTLWPTGGVFHVMTVTNSGTLVAGFTIRGGGGSGNTPRALRVSPGTTVSNCLITANTGGTTIELYGLMTHCVVTNNGSYNRPVYVDSGGVLQDSRIAHNSGAEYGGLVVAVGGTVRRCRIHNNWTAGYGHTINLSGRMENSLIYANSLSGNYAAGVAVANAAASLVNCVVFGNTASGATTGGAGVKRTAGSITNSIIYGNTGPSPADYSGTVIGVVYHSLAPTLTAGSQGNITGDPMFVDPTLPTRDFRLLAGSPCRDSGTNLVNITHDIDGTSRPLAGGTLGGLFHDMGAYEMDGTSGDFTVGFHGDPPLSGFAPLDVVFHANAAGANTNVTWYGWDFNNDGNYEQSGAGLRSVTHTFGAGRYSVRVAVSNDTPAVAMSTNENYIAVIGTDMFVATNGENIFPYTNWVNAATNIHDAMDVAVGGSTVHVGAGGFPTTKRIVLSAGIKLLGAGPGSTTIYRNAAAGNFGVFSLEHTNAFIAGLAITNGYGTATEPAAVKMVSGTVSNCVITRSSGAGSWMVTTIASGARMTHSAVSNNATYSGAVWVSDGGLIEDSLIMSNSGTDRGGMYLAGTARRVKLIGNTTGYSTAASAVQFAGGAMINCLIAHNRSTVSGPAIGMSGGRMVHCTVASNHTFSGTSAGVNRTGGTITNSILFANGNNSAVMNYNGTEAGVVYSSCSPGLTPGSQGNIAADPLFVSLSLPTDFRLQSISPCIDTGVTLADVTDDLERDVRPQDGNADTVFVSDMGAYEMPETAVPLSVTFAGAPLAGIGSVTSVFTAGLVGSITDITWWGWDFNNDGNIDLEGADLGTVTNVFGIGRHSVSLHVTNSALESASVTNLNYVVVVSNHLYVATDGLSQFPYADWANAATNIHDAVDVAVGGCTIHVGEGNFRTTKKIALSQAIRVMGNGPSLTTVRRDANAGDFGVFHLTHADALVAGLSVTNGYGNSGLSEAASFTITSGTVSNCLATRSFGAGFWNSVIIGAGGRMTHSAIVSNITYSGGVNVAAGGVIEDSLIGWNSGVDQGGLNLAGTGSRLRIVNNTANGSFGPAGATIVASGVLENSLIAGNAHGGTGSPGGVSTAGRMINCTVSGNANAAGSLTGSGLRQTGGSITNTIIYGNTGSGGVNYTTTGGTIRYSLAPELTPDTADENLNTDPLFEPDGTYLLQRESPAIDAGIDQEWMLTATDLQGVRRIFGSRVDMGCYETPPPAGTIFILR